MPKKQIGAAAAVALAAMILLGSGVWFGYYLGRELPRTVVVRNISNTEHAGATANFGTFWQAWELIEQEHLKGLEVSPENKVYGAVKGLVQSLGDPYSEFFKPIEGKRFQENVHGDFGGLGIEINLRKGQLVIVAPLKGTPAEEAGLKPNDQITKINASSTENITLEEAVNLLRGPEGTKVTLGIFRENWDKPKDFEIIRAKITIPTLDFAMKPDGIAHVQLYSFNKNAASLFYEAMIKATQAQARGIILDVRNDPGGYLDVAVDLAGWFLPRGAEVVSEVGREGVKDVLRANGNEALTKIPVVVLINKGSASASEILAGALRDHRGVKLVGEQSFGKGTVQQIENLPDGSSLKLTIAKWVMPKGLVLEGEGLKPDYEVKISDEDAEAKRDPQLEKAIEILKSEISQNSS